MRIDKYLWCVRVYKTRSIAAVQCRTGKVWLNNELVKPSREVKANDEIKVRKGPVHFSIRIISFPTSRVGSKLVADCARDITPKEELDKLELIRLQQRDLRPRGLGRPSKKDRRQLDDFVTFSDWDEDDLISENDSDTDGSETN